MNDAPVSSAANFTEWIMKLDVNFNELVNE
jgi:hypothetical protein